MNSMRIAFFGGSFDPPHCGHLAIAAAAADRLQLDRILVATVGTQPLKADAAHAAYPDRLAMTRLAFAADPRCLASDLDAPHADNSGSYTPNYTYDTLSRFQQTLSPTDRLFCLLGADSFHTVRHWHRATELLLLCPFILAGRPGYDLGGLAHRLPIGLRITDEQPGTLVTQVYIAETANPENNSILYILNDLAEDISATTLRHALATGESTIGMLTPSVANYITEHDLYRTPISSV